MPHSQPLSTKTATAQSRSSSDLEIERAVSGAAGFHGPSEALNAYTNDPFGGYFAEREVAELLADSALLDTANVRRWFELFAAGLPHSLYTYQLPLSRKAGPNSAALGAELIMFSSYSYLGLIGNARVGAAVQRAVELYGTSTGGVRLLTGTLALHQELERELADFLGQEGAAVFSSGYDANIAAITSLFGPGDLALLDQNAHQSIVDLLHVAGEFLPECERRGVLRVRAADLDDVLPRLRLVM